MDDLISRQAAIAHAVPLNLFGREVMMVSVSELENLPSAQPEVMTEMSSADTISRQAAIDIVEFECGEWSGLARTIAKVIEQLPSAQRTGQWKVSDLPKGKMKYCSECGFGQYIADERRYGFCPNCGADMRGEQDE